MTTPPRWNRYGIGSDGPKLEYVVDGEYVATIDPRVPDVDRAKLGHTAVYVTVHLIEAPYGKFVSTRSSTCIPGGYMAARAYVEALVLDAILTGRVELGRGRSPGPGFHEPTEEDWLRWDRTEWDRISW